MRTICGNNAINELMIELLEKNTVWQDSNVFFTKRGREIIDEISDYAELTCFFRDNKDKGEIFDQKNAYQVFCGMLGRIAGAPTVVHSYFSVVGIMPYVRQKLRELDERKEKCRDISNK